MAVEQFAALELGELLSSPAYYGFGVPRGAGQPVLLLPGFLGSDGYLTLLSNWLERIGYRPQRSGIGINAGYLPALLGRVLGRVRSLAAKTGPITILGHSLGGVFARVLAVANPGLVRRVITLGSPLHGHPRDAAHPFVRALGEVLMVRSSAEEARVLALLNSPLPPGVRLTSIYSRSDAVVDWRSCIDRDPRAENIEVRGSHVGLAWNASVYRRIGEALAA